MSDTSVLDHALMIGAPLSLGVLIAVGIYGVLHRDRAMHFGKNLVHKPYRWGHSSADRAPEPPEAGEPAAGVQAVPDEVSRPDGPHEP